MAIRPTRLGHLVLRVRNVDRAEEFYGGILGLEVKGRIEDKMVFFRSNPDVDHDLAIMAIGEGAPGPHSEGVGLYHFAYELGSFEELQDAYRTVVENNVRIAGYGDHGDTKGLYIFDPDGNEIELYALAPGSEDLKLESMLKDGIGEHSGVAG